MKFFTSLSPLLLYVRTIRYDIYFDLSRTLIKYSHMYVYIITHTFLKNHNFFLSPRFLLVRRRMLMSWRIIITITTAVVVISIIRELS